MTVKASHEDRDAALDREIAALLDVQPSPGFASGVRGRVAGRTAQRQQRRRRLLTAASAAAAVVVGLVVAELQRPSAPVDTAVALPAREVVHHRTVILAPAPGLTVSRDRGVFAAPRARRVAGPVRESAPGTGEVLIAPDEAAGLNLLIVQAAAGEITGTSARGRRETEPPDEESAGAIVIARIEIPPLTTDPLPEGVRQ